MNSITITDSLRKTKYETSTWGQCLTSREKAEVGEVRIIVGIGWRCIMVQEASRSWWGVKYKSVWEKQEDYFNRKNRNAK